MTQTTKKRVLIRAARAAESDLYIWGTREVLHPDDRPKEETVPEAEEAAPEQPGAAGPEAVEVSSVEEQLQDI